MIKFLIDENLSPALEGIAIEAGYPASAHIAHRGLLGAKDPVIASYALDGDWTLVTGNAKDFRPKKGSSSKAPCYVGVELHAGLVCLNLPPNCLGDMQERYFRVALDEIAIDNDMTNQILEVWPDPENTPDHLKIERYSFPED